jgi:hypothetical protein
MAAQYAAVLCVEIQPGYKTHNILVEDRQARPGCVAGGMLVSKTATIPLHPLLIKTNIKFYIFYLRGLGFLCG